jgi:hypothetical protein
MMTTEAAIVVDTGKFLESKIWIVPPPPGALMTGTSFAYRTYVLLMLEERSPNGCSTPSLLAARLALPATMNGSGFGSVSKIDALTPKSIQ